MPAIRVRFFDGRTTRRHDAWLDFADGRWQVSGDFGTRTARRAEVDVGEAFAGAPRLLSWPNGAGCEIDDEAGFSQLMAAAGRRESVVVRMQRRWAWAAGALAGVVVALVAAYLVLLPWLAGKLAPAIPQAATAAISRQVLASLDEHLLQPSKLAPQRQQAIGERLAEFARRSGGVPAHRLHFRAAAGLGPNAFALPGGDIVVLDALVELAGHDDEIVAVVAHELGHVAHHHGMRQLLQSAVVSFVVGVYFGDVSSLAASLTALVLESRYSREFELEADRYGGRLLLAAGRSPELLAAVLERLEAAQAKRHGNSGGAMLATHPDSTARIAALRQMR